MKKTLLFLSLFFTALRGFCTTYTAVANGNFEDVTTWSPAGGPPGTGDNVIIPAGFTVTVTANNTALLNNLSLSGTLGFTGGAKLNFAGSATIQVYSGGIINGGNTGSKLVFPGTSYSGPFTASGPYYFTNTGSGSGTLAVTLLSFTSETTTAGIKLSWQAASETDIANYELQWSPDGTTNWKTIYVQQANNAGTNAAYSFVQQNDLAEKNYYRIKTNEKNNSFSNSGIITAVRNNKLLLQIVPSVTKGFLSCKMAAADAASLKVTDISGKTISQVNNLHTMQYNMQLQNLPVGVYFITLIQNGSIVTKKIIRQ